MRSSVKKEYIELVDQNSDHQYEQVEYSEIKENADQKPKANFQVFKTILIFLIVFVVVVTLILICIVLGIYIFNLLKVYIFEKHNDTLQSLKKLNSQLEEKQKTVKEMFLDSWNAYVRHAWGHEAVKPISKTTYSGYMSFGNNSGLSIVSAMSTLWIMGLKKEFDYGKKWIDTRLDLRKIKGKVKVFEVIVNYIGGLLSCYALTSESLFLDKANEIGQMLENELNNITGEHSSLSEMGGFKLEYNYLSDLTKEKKFLNRIQKIQNILMKIEKPKNLYLNYINNKGYWISSHSSLSTTSREMYISLVKSFIQLNLNDTQSIEMYKEALDAIDTVQMIRVSPSGLYYARSFTHSTNSYGNLMEYSSCYLGAMLSIGANAMQKALNLNSSIGYYQKVKEEKRIYRHWLLAEKITETCQDASILTITGLGPYAFYYNDTHDVLPLYKNYILSSELAESNFILWRLTHNNKYRDYAWQMVQAIIKHCSSEGGISAIWNVDQIPTKKDDVQPAILLSATLKYLYLTFTDDSVLNLEEWVFNPVGHPLPICGNNTMYPIVNCKRSNH